MKVLDRHGFHFKDFLEGKETLDEPHTVPANPPLQLPPGIERLSEAFKKSKEVPIGKEVAKEGGEKNVTMRGKKIYVAGEAVTDYLLGRTPHDFQVVTDAHPDEVVRICQHARPPIQVLRKDIKNGVVKVSVDNETIEIETMKVSSEEGKTIFTADPREDSSRRQLTGNSLYYDVAGKKIIDYHGGIRHIKDGTVRWIGKPEDHLKDGVNKLRYANFVHKIGGKPDEDTKKAFEKHTDDDTSPEKIRDEFWKGLEDLHANVIKFVKTYQDLGLLASVFPDLELSPDFPECKTCKSRPVVLAHLLKNNRPADLVEKLRKLKYTDREIKDAVFLINLLIYRPDYIHEFKSQLLRTALTRRQIGDWAKSNKLDMEMINSLLGGDNEDV